MEVIVTKTFTKQFLCCPKNIITSLETAKSIFDIKDIEKLAGFKIYYRARIGHTG